MEPLLEKGITIKRTKKHHVIMNQTFEGMAQLAKRLPTGIVTAFALLSPVLTSKGDCDPTNRAMTYTLIALGAVGSTLLSLTDSFRGKNGKVYHGLATFKGMWVIDGSTDKLITQREKDRFKIRFPDDYVHAFVTVLAFVAIVLLDKDMVRCFYPNPSRHTKTLLASLPVGIGLICSVLFVKFPLNRHGIGFPLTHHETDNAN